MTHDSDSVASPTSKTVTAHCLTAHTVQVSFFEETSNHYLVSPNASVIEEIDTGRFSLTGEFFLYCKECQTENHYLARRYVPSWAQALYDRVVRVYTEQDNEE